MGYRVDVEIFEAGGETTQNEIMPVVDFLKMDSLLTTLVVCD